MTLHWKNGKLQMISSKLINLKLKILFNIIEST